MVLAMFVCLLWAQGAGCSKSAPQRSVKPPPPVSEAPRSDAPQLVPKRPGAIWVYLAPGRHPIITMHVLCARDQIRHVASMFKEKKAEMPVVADSVYDDWTERELESQSLLLLSLNGWEAGTRHSSEGPRLDGTTTFVQDLSILWFPFGDHPGVPPMRPLPPPLEGMKITYPGKGEEGHVELNGFSEREEASINSSLSSSDVGPFRASSVGRFEWTVLDRPRRVVIERGEFQVHVTRSSPDGRVVGLYCKGIGHVGNVRKMTGADGRLLEELHQQCPEAWPRMWGDRVLYERIVYYYIPGEDPVEYISHWLRRDSDGKLYFNEPYYYGNLPRPGSLIGHRKQ
mgnify:CR=1 FL=1